ncbi:NAD(P)/FAD-dependent oxidoreductase [Microbulbifer epialgicus]|uniref:NAD(P)/FAD-dependent oxidoreductase n=1 Tax=Microbulbifer epialgicus TaxID=393907 RepID=A0ABV4P0P2_9GAMM
MERADTIVVGAGALGLASGYALARTGREVLVLEQHSAIGTEISSRSSEVIHAGIYYPTGSLKARACVEGKAQLYKFCREHAVPYKRIGKLVVANSEDQLPQLKALKTHGDTNGAGALRLLNAREARTFEPKLNCHAALYSPTTGIFDSHALLLALQGALEREGGLVVLSTKVASLKYSGDGYQLTMENGDRLKTSRLAIAGGLHSNQLLSSINDESIRKAVPALYLAKGNYFTLSHKPPFSHLIYPLPEPGGLGIHLTLDMEGYARFGPDVEWVDNIDYSVDSTRKENFYQSIRRYWPDLAKGALQPDYAGIRPKVVPEGAPAGDFKIFHRSESSGPKIIAFFGIESPGLTSCLFLGNRAADLLNN